ncbi:MAG: hypothetical protein FJ276_25320 [Planctomycetes bacterium]|nr:hypothetical protein [Planctomycetota bacterium]
MTSINQILTRQKQLETEAEDAYHAAVRRIADDKPLAEKKLFAILRDADRSADDLERDVQTLRQRKAWRQQLDSLPDLERRFQDEETALQQLCAEFEKLEREHEDRCLPHENEIRRLRQERLDISGVKQRLLNSVVDSRLLSQQKQVLAQRRLLVEQRHEQSQLIGRIASRVEYAEGDESKRAASRLKQEREKLAETDKQLAEMDERLLELAERMLEP